MQKQPRLLIRTDANARMGIGHVMRCLALAQAWQDAGGQVTFFTIPDSSKLEDRLKSQGMAVDHLLASPGSSDDAIQTASLAQEINASWVVLDGYQFDSTYQRSLKGNGRHFLVVDDYGHADYYYANIVLNHNLYAHEGIYANKEPYTQTLIGTQYTLLGRRFEKWRQWQREIPAKAGKVLVTLGGGDPENFSLNVIKALQQLDEINMEVKVIVGPTNPHFNILKRVADRSTFVMQILTYVDDMPALMAWADIAITAGGSTCWEIAYMGLPNCTIVLADNQVPVAEILQKIGVSVNLGWFRSIDPTNLAQTIGRLVQDSMQRESMSVRGKSVITGMGSQNVVRAMLEY